MNRRREKGRSLSGSRIYVRRGKYQYFAPEPMFNPQTGRTTRWVILCPESEGELAARIKLSELLGHAKQSDGRGDFPIWFDKWRMAIMAKRTKDAPKDPARAKIWDDGTKGLASVLKKIEDAFADFDINEVQPSDVAEFLDQWEGRRSAQSYKGHITKFYAWANRRGFANKNPAREVSVEKPPNRDVYMTHDQYHAIRDALLIGKDKRPTRTGAMVQCYMDLLYLLYQRGTEVRLLRWDQVTPEGITFKPTKTEKTSGIKVMIPMTSALREVLDRAKSVGKMRSMYVIHTEHGQPYTAHGIGSSFDRAKERAGILGVTLKDVRAKAATDAKDQGYSMQEIQIALAQADESTTRGYVRSREVPVSVVNLVLPKK
ncbi:MAG: tyrosine-type recombinase/integrase [Polynucleobacter sp.]|nr:tyrosine-type recombinase/integrase [Polynucleobacter sp.]